MRGITMWWQQPDHFDWLSAYLRTRGLLTMARGALFAILFVLAGATVLMLWSPAGPRGLLRLVTYFVTAGLCGLALLYLLRWPTRLQSQIFSAAGSIYILLGCLVADDPRTALLGCSAFAGLAGYVAFFHTARHLAATLAIALVTAAICTARIAAAGDPALAFSSFLVLCAGMLAVPVTSQILVHWLWIDARRSSTDALTGLYNRRGVYEFATQLIDTATEEPSHYIVVVMADLDHFKQINDTMGHAAGDQVLVAVADMLRQHYRHNAAPSRIGGEEFLIVQLSNLESALQKVEHVRSAIESTPWRITASFGMASALAMAPDSDRHHMLDQLTRTADSAMYEAKHRGGNQIRHVALP